MPSVCAWLFQVNVHVFQLYMLFFFCIQCIWSTVISQTADIYTVQCLL